MIGIGHHWNSPTAETISLRRVDRTCRCCSVMPVNCVWAYSAFTPTHLHTLSVDVYALIRMQRLVVVIKDVLRDRHTLMCARWTRFNMTIPLVHVGNGSSATRALVFQTWRRLVCLA